MSIQRSSALLALICLGCGDTHETGSALEAEARLGPAASVGTGTPERATARGAIVYLVDTLRADHLGCYGYERDTTPTLDAFAGEAVLFENCMSQSSWTKPSSASVLTGLYPSLHGATSERAPIPESVETLAEALRAVGVRTAGFYANVWVSDKNGFAQGFERFDFTPRELEHLRGPALIQKALEWIEGVGTEPFFAYLHQVEPHSPYDPPPPFDTRFGDSASSSVDGHYGHAPGQSLGDLEPADMQRLVDLYDGEVAYTDELFGSFVEGLERLGRFEDSLIVFVADHGEEFGDHDGWRHNPRLYQEVIHVPLICRFPGDDPRTRGRRHGGLALQVDIMPTVLEAMGLSIPDGLSGRSLRSLLEDDDPARIGFCEAETDGRYRKAVVQQGLKYIRAWAPTEEEFLFDLTLDPNERQNLLPDEGQRAERLKRRLEEHVAGADQGYYLLFQNGFQGQRKVECMLFTDKAHLEFTSLYTELRPAGGTPKDHVPRNHEADWEGRVRKGTHMVFNAGPGDGDGLHFLPAPGEERVEIVVRVDGELIDPARVFLGRAGFHPAALPLELDLAAGEGLEAPMFAVGESLNGDPYRLRIWRGLDRSPQEDVEFAPEDLEALQAMGYLGGE